jgi:hypothetical protein
MRRVHDQHYVEHDNRERELRVGWMSPT